MDKTKSKIVIIGPFGDFGGRELESGFIARSLSETYKLTLCSTVMMSSRSQVYQFIDQSVGFSILEKVFQNNLAVRMVAGLSKLLNSNSLPAYAFVKNRVSKRFLNVEKKIIQQLNRAISEADLIFIVAQLSSQYVSHIISEAELLKKPVIFRTTGTIRPPHLKFPFLGKVDLYLHHSERNSLLLQDYPYQVIDQTCYSEKALLSLPIEMNGISNFSFLGRLSVEKGILEVLQLFQRWALKSHRLNIFGEGPLEAEARQIAQNDTRIKFHGFVEQQRLKEVFKKTDCLLIPSKEEAGPLSGLEAMAAGKVILSTDVGAMKERLRGTGNDFWFDLQDSTSFGEQLNRMSSLDPRELEEIRTNNRKRYLEAYQLEKIAGQYKDCVDYLI